MSGTVPGGGVRGSKPPKRVSTYESQSPPLVYSPSLIRSRPSSRCLRTTHETSFPVTAPGSYGRLPTWVVNTFRVERFILWYGTHSLGGGTHASHCTRSRGRLRRLGRVGATDHQDRHAAHAVRAV